MDNSHRNASDVLLDLESKLNVALGIIKTQDFNFKIINNKLNNIISLLEKQGIIPSNVTVEAVDVSGRDIPISSDFALKIDESPNGFRRSSRPETFSNAPLERMQLKLPKQPVEQTIMNNQFPGMEAEVLAPNIVEPINSSKHKKLVQNAIPITQRVVNSDGKSLYLADVELIDLATMESLFKTRTNGTGKWSASLAIGNYRVIINKRESSSGGRLEATQDIKIDGSKSKIELQTIIIRA